MESLPVRKACKAILTYSGQGEKKLAALEGTVATSKQSMKSYLELRRAEKEPLTALEGRVAASKQSM